MDKPEIQIRRAEARDAADIGRLLHDFNSEYEEPAPAAEELARTVAALLETDTAARALYESTGFTNREGGPDGPSMLFYEREI